MQISNHYLASQKIECERVQVVRSLRHLKSADPAGDQQMETFYSVDAPEKKLDELAKAMFKLDDLVEAAYVKPESGRTDNAC